jgi:hypothetical protein
MSFQPDKNNTLIHLHLEQQLLSEGVSIITKSLQAVFHFKRTVTYQNKF